MSARSGKLAAFLRSLPGALVRNWHITLPVVICLVLCAPFTWFLLPSYEPLFADEYQPLKALKFFYSRGQEFHKWGPLTDLLLGPVYALTLGYWHLAGQFEHPSIRFPYGFKDPIWQLTTLIFEGRVLFLAFNLACTAVLGRFLRLVTSSKSVVFLTLLTMVCANPVMVELFPDTKPDGPATAFSALALCVYLVVWKQGLTTERAVWMSFLAVLAVSGKELCAAIFVLPYAAMIVRHLGVERTQGRPFLASCRAPLVGVLVGLLSYALVNIVYAPRTWWARIQFWTSGPGKDSGIWGGGFKSGEMTAGTYGTAVLETIFNNIGPLGALLAVVAALALLTRRPKGWVFLSLPFVSVMALGLLPMGYVEDRFYIVAALAFVPMMALGLDALLAGRAEPRLAALLNPIATVTAVWFGLIPWYYLRTHYLVTAERYLAEHADKSLVITDGATFQGIPGKSRLAYLGYTVDMRALDQIVESSPQNRPDILLLSQGRLHFIEDAVRFPARARMMAAEGGFNLEVWESGFGSMGYGRPLVLEPTLPRWLPFSWVPAVQEWNRRHTLLVYRKPGSAG